MSCADLAINHFVLVVAAALAWYIRLLPLWARKLEAGPQTGGSKVTLPSTHRDSHIVFSLGLKRHKALVIPGRTSFSADSKTFR